MHPKNFGHILKSLRLEHINAQTGHLWTQADLALAANLSAQIIGKIEQGKRAVLDHETLLNLALALNLSALEWREFSAAAAEGNQPYLACQMADEKKIFDEVWQTLITAQQPACLFDAYHDLIGLNKPLLAFQGLSTFSGNPASEMNMNILHLLFAPQSPLRESLQNHWTMIATAYLHRFRVTILQYRHTERFATLLQSLHRLPDFSALWMMTRTAEMACHSRACPCQYDHSLYGPVHYTEVLITTLTPSGPLYLTIYSPANRRTQMLFADLTKAHQGVLQINPWPNPNSRLDG